MEPHIAANDKIIFYKYLDKATVYFEYGSGGSTYQASIRPNINRVYSVESDNYWLEKVKQQVNSDKVTFFYNEMDAQPNTWGHPGKNSTPAQRIKYSTHMPVQLNKEEQQHIDLVLIDGRFRVACCLKCFDVITYDCFIAFDDFLDRPHYHIVLEYFDIVEQTTDKRMVILQKKKGITSIPIDIIKKYELVPG